MRPRKCFCSRLFIDETWSDYSFWLLLTSLFFLANWLNFQTMFEVNRDEKMTIVSHDGDRRSFKIECLYFKWRKVNDTNFWRDETRVQFLWNWKPVWKDNFFDLVIMNKSSYFFTAIRTLITFYFHSTVAGWGETKNSNFTKRRSKRMMKK